MNLSVESLLVQRLYNATRESRVRVLVLVLSYDLVHLHAVHAPENEDEWKRGQATRK